MIHGALTLWLSTGPWSMTVEPTYTMYCICLQVSEQQQSEYSCYLCIHNWYVTNLRSSRRVHPQALLPDHIKVLYVLSSIVQGFILWRKNINPKWISHCIRKVYRWYIQLHKFCTNCKGSRGREYSLPLAACLELSNIYSTVVRSIANISDPKHIYRGTKDRGKYAAKVGYRGYRPTYRAIYTI